MTRLASRIPLALLLPGLLGAGAAGQSEAGAPAAAEARSPAAAASAETLLEQLRQRSAELERRESELAARERSLADLDAQVARRLDELEAVRKVIEQKLAAWKEESGDQVLRLAKVYGEMPPGEAAPLLEALEPDLASDILRRMKNKQAAAVLALMSRPHALRLSRMAARPLAQIASPAAGEAR
jgi:flagellar motility protein MotE (MotC chaperone)